MSRVQLIPAGTASPHRSDQVIVTYPSGERLVRTDDPATEAGTQEVPHGLVLEGIGQQDLEGARMGLQVESGDAEVLAYVTLAGPTVPAWLVEMEAAGVVPLRFQPRTSYLAKGRLAAFKALKQKSFVVDVTPLTAALKPSPRVPEAGTLDVWVTIEGSADEQLVLQRLSGVSGLELRLDGMDRSSGLVRVPASITAAARGDVLEVPMVLAIEPREPVRPEDEVAGLILAGQYDANKRPAGSYLTWLQNQKLDGRGVAIGIVDNGVDESHEAFTGRITAKESKRAWHGTFVAGHAAGKYLAEKDSNGFIYGVGMAPEAELISQDNTKAAAELCKETVSTSGPRGAAGIVQNNSWGAGTQNPMNYGSMEASYDGLVRNALGGTGTGRPLVICFSAGNEGAAGLTRPKAAKNIIVTGNSEVYRPTAGGTDSDNIDEIYTGSGASSHGNCGDSRMRPDVVAPGEWTASANFDSHPGQSEYISPKLTWGGGTSGASPKTAGACALLIQWWRSRNSSVSPSPALLKAMLVNGAEDTGFGGAIPNIRQGWGRVNLANVLSRHVHHLYVDQSCQLRQRGEQRKWRIRVSDPTKPLRVTLAWTDVPGPLNSGTASVPAVVNSLALRLQTGGSTYYANQFSGGFSDAGAAPPAKEGLDNLQCVYLRAGVAGSTVDVIVRALNITQNCLTNRPTDPRQDFALVVTNGFMDSGSAPTDLFVVVDDTTPGSTSSFDDVDDPDDPGGDDQEPTEPTEPTEPSEPVNRPTLRRGAMGADVRHLQQLLRQIGLLSALPDGVFGGGTEAAVKQFQRAQAMAVDGVVGPQTWQALEREAGGGEPPGGGGGPDPADPAPDPADPTPDPTDPTPDPAHPSDPTPTSRPTLRRGAMGNDVRDLQQLLQQLGQLAGLPDGIFGRGTEDAVKAFQRSQGMTADGVVGPQTWDALEREAAGGGGDPVDDEPVEPGPLEPDPTGTDPNPVSTRPTLRRGATGNDVRELQRLLIEAGFLNGAADGVFGGGTEAAVKAFQRSRSMQADGIVGPQTWQALQQAEEGLREHRPTSSGAGAVPGAPGASARPEVGMNESRSSEVADAARPRLIEEARRLANAALPGTRLFNPGEAAVSVENDVAPQADAGLTNLQRSLRRLMAQWDLYGAEEGDTTRRRAAVIVVGGETKVTREDVLALRRLALHGELHFVSARRSLLDLLAQHIHALRGVHFHLAAERQVPSAVRIATRIATGGQQLLLQAVRSSSGDGQALLFHLTEHDRRVVIDLPADAISGVTVTAPGQTSYRITTRSRRARSRLLLHEGHLTFEMEVDPAEAGQWQVQLPAESTAEGIADGWVWTDLYLDVARPELLTVEGADVRPEGPETVSVRGPAGTLLHEVRVVERSEANAAGEAGRAVVATARKRRLSNMTESSALVEADGAASEPTLSVRLPRTPDSKRDWPQVRSLVAEVRGTTQAGFPFRRSLHLSLVELVPWQRWRRPARRPSPAESAGSENYVPARVSQVQIDSAGGVTRLVLADRERERVVRVADPAFQKLLAHLRLKGRLYHFRLHGDEVRSLLNVLAAGGAKK